MESLSGLFIPSGPVVQVRDNNGSARRRRHTDGVTSAIKAWGWWCWSIASAPPPGNFFMARCRITVMGNIVGELTFGKGTVQQYGSLELYLRSDAAP